MAATRRPLNLPPSGFVRLRRSAITCVYRHLSAILLLVLATLSIGCSPEEELGRISGTVTHLGKPLSRGLVMFANRQKGVYMTAPIQPDGSYEVKMAKGAGLPLGDYDVAVAPPVIDHPIGPILNPPKLEDEPDFPAKYRTWDTSPLKVTIVSGENQLAIELE